MSLRDRHRRRVARPRPHCIVEGLPAGLELDREAINRDMARRQLGHGRGGRMKIESDTRRGHRRRAPRPHARRPDRAPGRQPRLRQLGGADEPVAGRGRGPRGPPPAPRPRRPRRHAGSTASPTCATCSSARARARPRRASPAARCAKAFLRALGVEVLSHVVQIGVGAARPRAATSRSRTSTASTTTRSAASTPRRARAMVEHINVQRKANESIGGVFEVHRVRARARPRLARLVGGAARRPDRRGAAARSRRSRASALGDGFDLAGAPGSRGPRRDLLRRRSAATTARRTTPAASRAA